jgi:hypothetical protein
MPQTSTEKPGTSTSKSTKVSSGEARDARITAAGLLNNIIASGRWEPEDWPYILVYALDVHQYGTRKALRLQGDRPPEWKKEKLNGNQD